MKGDLSFSPQTGHDLDREKHLPGALHEAPQREATTKTGELALGGRRSSREALAQHFARSYAKSHYGRPPPGDVKRTAAYGLYALKSRSETNPPDDHVWLALTEYLARSGFWAVWMHNHVDVCCPGCGSVCKWRPSLVGLDELRCGASCGTYSDRSFQIVDRVLELYNATLAESDGRIESLSTV